MKKQRKQSEIVRTAEILLTYLYVSKLKKIDRKTTINILNVIGDLHELARGMENYESIMEKKLKEIKKRKKIEEKYKNKKIIDELPF